MSIIKIKLATEELGRVEAIRIDISVYIFNILVKQNRFIHHIESPSYDTKGGDKK